MFEIVIFFLVLLFIFGMTKPNAMKTENPFTGPKFSWKMAFVFALVITAVAAGVLYVGIPHLNKNKKVKGGGTSEGEAPSGNSALGENHSTSSMLGKAQPLVTNSDNTLQLKQFAL